MSFTQKIFLQFFLKNMKIQNGDINFKAGLTRQLKSEITFSNVKQISNYISKNGIPNDFKENKLIAWCSLKCLEIIKTLNKEYNLHLGLPKGIFVEDFKLLNIANSDSVGFTNLAPSKLYLKKNIIIPEKTLFFNEFKNFNYKKGNEYWDKIDDISDANFDSKRAATDFFMEIFFHEFSHAIHEEHLISKFGGKKTVKIVTDSINPSKSNLFRVKNKNLLDSICRYASTNQFEAVACDLSKRFIKNLNTDKLTINDNFLLNSPYHKKTLFTLLITNTSPLYDLLRKCWNGKA